MKVNRTSQNQRGTILIIVMWVSLGLVSLALVFGDSMRLEYQAAENLSTGAQAEHAIDGVRRYVEYLLTNNETPGYLPDDELYEPEMIEVGSTRAWLIGRSADESNPDDTMEFGLQDEAARLNLNTATFDMLMNLPEMTEELAGAIIDWRDEDDEITELGAESDFYLANDPSYPAKNAAFESIEELKLLNGADWDILVGEDLNQNGLLDENENNGDESMPEDDANGVLKPGIFEYVTVYSQEPNKQEDGSERINVREQDSRQELQQLFTEAFGQDRANQILGAVGNNTNNFQSVLQYYMRSGMTPEEFLEVYDALSVSGDEFLVGLVNVSTAPVSVLACIPGIGTEFAAELVSQRVAKSEDELKTVGWVKDVLPEENAIQAGPFLTARTYQVRADIAAVGQYGRGSRRVVYIFDTSGEETNVIYRKDLSRLGWPLGNDVREEIKLEEWN